MGWKARFFFPTTFRCLELECVDRRAFSLRFSHISSQDEGRGYGWEFEAQDAGTWTGKFIGWAVFVVLLIIMTIRD